MGELDGGKNVSEEENGHRVMIYRWACVVVLCAQNNAMYDSEFGSRLQLINDHS